MRLLADENIEAAIIRRLRNEGNDVVSVAEDFPSVTDKEVLNYAISEKRVLLTNDKDFGEQMYRSVKEDIGIILLRLHSLPATLKVEIISKTISQYSEKLTGGFCEIFPDSIRVKHKH